MTSKLKRLKEKYDVFISVKSGDADEEARQLLNALETRGIASFLCDMDTSQRGKTIDEVVEAFSRSTMAVILGTEAYGEKGVGNFDTKQILEFIMKEEKPYYLVKMCKRFKVINTRFYLNEDISYHLWDVGQPMPETLVDSIMDRLVQCEEKQDRPLSGHGSYRFNNGTSYTGLWRKGLPNGLGKLYFLDGSTFEGTFKDGKRQGLGKYLYGRNSKAPGDSYEGEFVSGKREGHGTYVYSSEGSRAGDKYVGNWKDGKRHGHGTYFYADGAKFEGEWNCGLKEGQGIHTYGGKDVGDVYTGNYHNNKRHGQGRYNYANGNYYIGEWKENEKHGRGTFVWAASGNRYVGGYANGWPEGYGEFSWGPESGKHGEMFKGEWKMGKQQGKGVLASKRGATYSGVWNEFEPVIITK